MSLIAGEYTHHRLLGTCMQCRGQVTAVDLPRHHTRPGVLQPCGHEAFVLLTLPDPIVKEPPMFTTEPIGTCTECQAPVESAARIGGTTVLWPCGHNDTLAKTITPYVTTSPVPPMPSLPSVAQVAEAALRHDYAEERWDAAPEDASPEQSPFDITRRVARRRTLRATFYGEADRWLRHTMRSLGLRPDLPVCENAESDDQWCRHEGFRHVRHVMVSRAPL